MPQIKWGRSATVLSVEEFAASTSLSAMALVDGYGEGQEFVSGNDSSASARSLPLYTTLGVLV